jgi:hypothetical protein
VRVHAIGKDAAILGAIDKTLATAARRGPRALTNRRGPMANLDPASSFRWNLRQAPARLGPASFCRLHLGVAFILAAHQKP